MRISELARESGIPIPTIKYYLREGLLPPGLPTAATQAEYGDGHVERLRLIRALVDIGRLPLASVRDIVGWLDDDAPDVGAVVGAAHEALPPTPEANVDPARALALTERLGWTIDPGSTSLHRLAEALQALDDVGLAPDDAKLDIYARAAAEVAEVDIATTPVPGQDDATPADVVRYVVVGTVLYEPLLLALRRLAQQDLFYRR